MSQPVKLSDALVLDARLAAEVQERSIAGQVEFWAKLGRSIELLLDGQQLIALTRTVGATPLAELVEVVGTPAGRAKLRDYLENEPYPHFEAHPILAGLLIRTDKNFKRTVGRFVNREFVEEFVISKGAFEPFGMSARRSMNEAQDKVGSKAANKKRVPRT
jgi:ParD-like antitoxin of type II bacterial toxin-antitoxin system